MYFTCIVDMCGVCSQNDSVKATSKSTGQVDVLCVLQMPVTVVGSEAVCCLTAHMLKATGD